MVHILLIEDNAADVMLVREALRSCSLPADVVIAYDGDEGLRLLTESKLKPDFVLLDLNLPKYSGLELLERCRAEEGAPVIVLSGSQNPGDRERALELGAREYVQKPLDFNSFMRAVHGIVMRWAGFSSGLATN
jgi:two-component system response regulator